jgi:hypothetical protein
MANAVESDVVLNWVTASETNNKAFELERSVNGVDFEYFGTVKGAGNTTLTQRYSATDKNALALASVLYYRLKQVDFDGKYTYSNTVVVDQFATDEFASNVFPNPFVDNFMVEIKTPQSGLAELTLIDITGKVIAKRVDNLQVGGNLIDFTQTSEVISGVYFLTVKQGDFYKVQKIISIK